MLEQMTSTKKTVVNETYLYHSEKDLASKAFSVEVELEQLSSCCFHRLAEAKVPRSVNFRLTPTELMLRVSIKCSDLGNFFRVITTMSSSSILRPMASN